MVASTNSAPNGQPVIHTAPPHTAQQLAAHHATLWPAIRPAFGLATDMAAPELEPDDTWSKVVIKHDGSAQMMMHFGVLPHRQSQVRPLWR